MLKRSFILFSMFLAYGIVLAHNFIPHDHERHELHSERFSKLADEHDHHDHEDHQDALPNQLAESSLIGEDDHHHPNDFTHALAHYNHSDVISTGDNLSVQKIGLKDEFPPPSPTTSYTAGRPPRDILRKHYFPDKPGDYSGTCPLSLSLRAPPAFI